ncbi:MAG TPA: CHC2 zinc finger domain-containing protein, partial [Ktedonobacteraceae bacterium]
MIALSPTAPPLERVLALLSEVKRVGRSYAALCPAHLDRTPSLSIWEDSSDGHVMFKCWSHGCATDAICAALGLEQSDLYRTGGRPRKRGPVRKIDVLDLAVDKNISPTLLIHWGVTDGYTWVDKNGRKHAGIIRIPYYQTDGTEHSQARIRLNLIAKEGSRWEGKGPLIPYGLWKLSEAQKADYCWLVEGESDCWTLWSRNLPALGIPGAGNGNTLQPGMLDGIARIYIVQEPGQAGEHFPARIVKRLRETGYAGECYCVSLQTLFQAKDPNDLLKKLWRESRMGEFADHMQTARESAQLMETSAEPDAKTLLAGVEQAVGDALLAQNASALYALVDRLACVGKADQAHLKSQVRQQAKRIAGFSQRDFNALLKDAQAHQVRKEAEERVRISGRPQIVLGRQLRDELTDSLDALHKANARLPRLFRRDRKLVRITSDEKCHPYIEPITIDALAVHLAEIADIVSYNREKGTYSSQHPPLDLIRAILASPEKWRFPALAGLTEIPIMRSDGSVLDTPGYDEATQLYYQPDPGLHIPSIPAHPTQQDVQRAHDFAFSFFAQFSYASQADRANAYGLVLALVMMEIARPALATLLTAATRGEGKGLFTDALAMLTTGSWAHTTTLPRDDAELKKELLGRLVDGETLISFDNIDGTVASRELDSFLTATNWGGRLLGSNTNVAAEKSRVLTLLNGNNVMIGGDLSRRLLPIRLASGYSHPWERPIVYRYRPLLEHVAHHRGDIIAALLTMVRAWHLAGRPLAAIRDESCFGPWKRAIGGMLCWLGI